MPKEFHGYKCEFCNRTRVNKVTIERHEKECLQNPNGKNCYKCENSVIGTYPAEEEYYSEEKDCAICTVWQEKLRTQGNYAAMCDYFKRANETYHNRMDPDWI